MRRQPQPRSTPPPAQIQKQTLAGIDKLQTWYTQSTGLYQTTGWWNSANALTMLADYSLVAHTASYTTVFSNSFQQAQKTNSGFLNNYYDDEGWWALAWIAAYDLTHTQQYLDMASSIFTDMSGGWDSTCGGGIWWSKDKTYKNAIANELFLSVAAHLANRVAPGRSRQLSRVGEQGMGVVPAVRHDQQPEPDQRRTRPHYLQEQRTEHLDLQPGRGPRRTGRTEPCAAFAAIADYGEYHRECGHHAPERQQWRAARYLRAELRRRRRAVQGHLPAKPDGAERRDAESAI